MAGNYSDKDSMDIKELASLNEDISDDFIAKLQQQLEGGNTNAANVEVNISDDSTLFEETSQINPETETKNNSVEKEVQKQEAVPQDSTKKEEISVNKNFDDNFIKKYKAKLNKKNNPNYVEPAAEISAEHELTETDEPIENLSQGNITEKPLTQEMKNYNYSLDFLDGNVKYSKYVIYIDPQNVDFIEGLTVKERKNLINGILRQQDDIAITKQRFKIMQTVIRQVIIAVLTISISIPVVYFVINASLEATIDNHRRSQSNWQTLYREHGKITQN